VLNKEYIPAIDGMRAVAIGLVIGSHFGAGRFLPGGFGVTLFFFISGYLITGLLIEEESATAKVNISSFYIRRFLRLAPALITMICTASGIVFLMFGSLDWWQILAGLLYYTNYYEILGGAGLMPIWQLWSLAVEEHYYLIFPLIFTFAWKHPERFLAGLVALTIVILLWRTTLVVYWKAPTARTYLATDTRIDSILYGAILAAVLKTRFANISRYFEHWAVVSAAAVVLLLTFIIRDPTFRETLRYSLQGIAILPLFHAILFVLRFSFARKVLEIPAMIWIGKLSYSLYLYHIVVFYVVATLLPNGSSEMLLALVSVPASLAAASFSYYCVEKHFQKLRNKFHARNTNYSSQIALIIQPKS
jgi:peptidoglycan/LPS O-acetylase OafA/YrhL